MSDLLRKLVDITAKALVTALGAGYSPWAPGTCGSLLALMVAWIFIPSVWWALPLAVLVVCIIGMPLSSWAERCWGSDPPRVVIDEVAGMWLSLVMIPKSLVLYPLAFFFFRLFDIVKPAGISRIQDLPGGWGVMSDDLLAGVYSNLFLQAALLIFYKKGSALAELLGLL